MSSAYALLGLPPRAALTEEQIQTAYHAAVKAGQDSAELHTAYSTLLHPEQRLKHLLSVAAPPEASAWRTVPMSEEMMQLFLHLGSLRTAAEQIIQRREAASSALSRALLEKQVLAQRDALETLGFSIEERKQAMLSKLPDLEEQWEPLAHAQAQLSYLAKWQHQVRELLLRLHG